MTRMPKSAELILDMARDLTEPIVYIGATVMIIAIVKYIFAWKNFNSEVQANATATFVGAAMVVSIRLILSKLFIDFGISFL